MLEFKGYKNQEIRKPGCVKIDYKVCECFSSYSFINFYKYLIMPEISRFLGITIAMFYKEHNPPHFHAYYGSSKIIVEIDSGKVCGKFPRRALLLVLEWWLKHREELLMNWDLAVRKEPLKRIRPLE